MSSDTEDLADGQSEERVDHSHEKQSLRKQRKDAHHADS